MQFLEGEILLSAVFLVEALSIFSMTSIKAFLPRHLPSQLQSLDDGILEDTFINSLVAYIGFTYDRYV
jgi:hypothetical protein